MSAPDRSKRASDGGRTLSLRALALLPRGRTGPRPRGGGERPGHRRLAPGSRPMESTTETRGTRGGRASARSGRPSRHRDFAGVLRGLPRGPAGHPPPRSGPRRFGRARATVRTRRRLSRGVRTSRRPAPQSPPSGAGLPLPVPRLRGHPRTPKASERRSLVRGVRGRGGAARPSGVHARSCARLGRVRVPRSGSSDRRRTRSGLPRVTCAPSLASPVPGRGYKSLDS